MASEKDRFRDFVKMQNEAAPFDHLLHAVQGEEPLSGDAFQKERGRLAGDLEGWLADGTIPAVAALPDEVRIALRDLLSERLASRLAASSSRVRSMLDLVTTGRVTEAQIDQLFRGYDVDLKSPEGLAYVDGVFTEAADFFDAYVASNDSGVRKVPVPLRNLEGTPDARVIYRTFKTAAGVEGQRMQIPFACALLRIAFVIDHAKTHPRIQAISEVHPSIQHRISEHLTPLESGGFIFRTRAGDPGIRLAGFLSRPKHPFSIYAKLLHKPETNVMALRDLWAGLFKTFTPQDTLRLMYALFFDPDDAIFSPFLIDPPNTDQLMFDQRLLKEALVDPVRARFLVERMADHIPSADMTHAARELFANGEIVQSNRNSFPDFRILKFVSAFRVTRDDGRAHRRSDGGESAVHRKSRMRRDVQFPLAQAVSVPIEFQFGDLETLHLNEGVAPHSGYKERQRADVQARLLGRNLNEAYAAWLVQAEGSSR